MPRRQSELSSPCSLSPNSALSLCYPFPPFLPFSHYLGDSLVQRLVWLAVPSDSSAPRPLEPVWPLLCRRTLCRHICAGIVDGLKPEHACSLHLRGAERSWCPSRGDTLFVLTFRSHLFLLSSLVLATWDESGQERRSPPCKSRTIVFVERPSRPIGHVLVSGRNEKDPMWLMPMAYVLSGSLHEGDILCRCPH